MMHDNDTSVMQNKKQETDFMHQGLKERQNEEKFMLGQIYQNQINQTKQIRQNEKLMEKELEKMQIERTKAIDPEAYNKLKKKAYQQEIRQEVEQKTKFKQYDQAVREQSMRENRRLMDDYAQNEMMNENKYRNKFSNFDQNMQKRLKDYNNFVMKPQLEKQTNLSMIEKKNIDLYNKQRANQEDMQSMNRKQQLLATTNEIRNQMDEKRKMKHLNSQLKNIEVEKTTDRVYEINTFDQMLKDDKKKRQEMYRQMLNSQVQYNNSLKSYGNMTHMEKQMNKEDLKAFKRYDKTQYGLIPGINDKNSKNIISGIPKNSYQEGMSHSRSAGKGFSTMNRSYSGHNANSFNQGAPGNDEAVPISRRFQVGTSPRSPPQQKPTLRNAGAISMSRDNANRPAGSPSGMPNPYASQVL